ncbi:DUF3108 domain-containing protein [Lutimonas sp.]|uniref:DUF3108 domain-containing protein n=1 Tax=Lutimonas sp. TaxID=1872403 RepID=UPI003D9B5DCE
MGTMIMHYIKKILPLCFLFVFVSSFSQNDTKSFQRGEFLKYKIQYGLLNAGFATVQLNEKTHENDSLIHAVGKGWTTGMVGFLFKVEDRYESYFGESDLKPKHFIRNIDEGGYTQDKEVFFDYDKKEANEVNHKKSTKSSYFIEHDVQDILSSFYYMRSIDFTQLHANDSIDVNMFFDGKMNPIKLIVLEREIIKTQFGKIKAIKIRPLVLKGRVFKDEENVTLWVSDDFNKIPLKIKAALLVGSAKAELIEYSGLVHPFP